MCPPESAVGFLDCMCDLDNFMKDIGGLFRSHTFEAQDALPKWPLLLRGVTARECKDRTQFKYSQKHHAKGEMQTHSANIYEHCV